MFSEKQVFRRVLRLNLDAYREALSFSVSPSIKTTDWLIYCAAVEPLGRSIRDDIFLLGGMAAAW